MQPVAFLPPFFASLALTIARLPCYRLVMAINLLTSLSLEQLHRAVAIKEQIAALETDLSEILGVPSSMTSVGNLRGRRKRSAVARARMAAAQKARWAKRDGKPAKKPRRKMSARARANLAAAARARWAKRNEKPALRPRRKMSAKARANLAAAARARWAKAKAAGKKSLGG